MTTKTTTTSTAGDETMARISALEAEAQKLRAQLARGSKDITAEALAATRSVVPLETRIEMALRQRPRATEELARDLKEAAGKVSTAMKTIRKHLVNVGTETAPAWFWVVGDKAPTEQINAAVEALVRYKDCTFPELIAATGARQGRVSGAIVKLQRDPKSRIVNFGTPGRAKWRILPEGIQLAKLKTR
jgi:hypothetical protein